MQSSEDIDTLAYAISDGGTWSWWASDLPQNFQIEFRDAMLWMPPRGDDQPPCHQLALRFGEPSHVDRICETTIPLDYQCKAEEEAIAFKKMMGQEPI